MEVSLLKDVLLNIAKHEGRSLSMYLDTKGVVTCGVGHALFAASEALKVCWWKTTDTLATRDDIVKSYEAIKSRVAKRALLMSYEESDRLLIIDLARFEHVINNEFPDFGLYPRSVQIAMYDIAFNCGSLIKWPKLTAAIKNRDWVIAAHESIRPEVGAERNSDTFSQFAYA